MEVTSSLLKSLEALDTCIARNTDYIEELESYVAGAEESAMRVRRSFTSIFPFGEFRAGKAPIHDNIHTSQRDAFVNRFLKPMDQRCEWTESEKELLQSAVEILYPHDNLDPQDVDWSAVAHQCVQLDRTFDRPPASCEIMFRHEIDGKDKMTWSKDEDELLSKLVTDFNGTNWNIIGDRLGRSPAACYKRCYANVHPVLVPVDFSKEDDERLIELVESLGDASWFLIASELGTGHTERQCMNRWTKTLKPGIRGGKWNPVLDAKLRAAVAVYGDKSWSQVAQHIEGKTDRKCRERYSEKLREGLKPATEWTASEDELLIQGMKQHGTGKWSRIASDLDGRTDQMCRFRFKKLIHDGSHNDLREAYEDQLNAKRVSKLARTRQFVEPSAASPVKRPRGRPRTPEKTPS
jgi:hypothetical protein